MSPLAEKLLQLVKERPGTSFVEILRIEGCHGDLAMSFEGYDNIIVWNGLSQDCIDALGELTKEKRIRVEGSIPMVYLIDGAVPNMPVAKEARQYKKPHWLPVVFWPIESKEEARATTQAVIEKEVDKAIHPPK